MAAPYLRTPGLLEAAELAGNEDNLVEALRHVESVKSRRQDRASQVLRILKETDSPRVRNAAAIALADMKVTTAKDELIKLLSRDDTKSSRGSLLYALEEMNAEIPPTVLADIIASDGYEAREEALRFLERQNNDRFLRTLRRIFLRTFRRISLKTLRRITATIFARITTHR